MKKLTIILALFLTGCTASMVSVRNDSNKSQYAPLNEKKGGTVKYQAGWNMTQNSDRERCYKKMYKSCGGDYIITKEYENSTHSNTMAYAPGLATTAHIVYKYLDFECVEKEPK